MTMSEEAELDGMGRDELLVVARRQAAEIATLRSMLQQDRAIAADALRRIEHPTSMPAQIWHGFSSEAH